MMKVFNVETTTVRCNEENAAYELNAHSILKLVSVRCNEERMQPMSNTLIVIIHNLRLLQRRDNAAYELNCW
jgi:hypothetical protein